jgi:hypothetical protein
MDQRRGALRQAFLQNGGWAPGAAVPAGYKVSGLLVLRGW